MSLDYPLFSIHILVLRFSVLLCLVLLVLGFAGLRSYNKSLGFRLYVSRVFRGCVEGPVTVGPSTAVIVGVLAILVPGFSVLLYLAHRFAVLRYPIKIKYPGNNQDHEYSSTEETGRTLTEMTFERTLIEWTFEHFLYGYILIYPIFRYPIYRKHLHLFF